MAKRRRSKYSGFKNFEKTYQRYVREYYRKARKLYIMEKKRDPSTELIKRGRGLYLKTKYKDIKVTKGMLREVMYDKDVLPRAEFASAYIDKKKEFAEKGITTDPLQSIVSEAAYKFSIKQYRGFRESVEEAVYYDPEFATFRSVTQEEFRTGHWEKERFFDMVKDYYYQKKKEGYDRGLRDKELWLYARDAVANQYFGSE